MEGHMKVIILTILLLLFTTAYSEGIICREVGFSHHFTDNGKKLINEKDHNVTFLVSFLTVPGKDRSEPTLEIVPISSEICQNDFLTSYSSISIPEGVNSIKENTWEVYRNAQIISFPSTLANIPEGSLIYISAEIVFPKGNPFYIMRDGFLIDIRTDTLLYSSPSSFSKAIPSVKHLGKHSLDNWLAGKTNVTLPESISGISTGVFYDLPDLKNIVLPAKLTEISSYSFNSVGIMEITIPPTISEIPAYCFVDCAITSISIPVGVERIGEYAFYYNWEMTEVTLSESVQFVGYNAFPESCTIIILNPDTHFETLEEYQVRDPDGEWW